MLISLKVGAGIDSFFEYAFKSHVLLSRGTPPPPDPSSAFAVYDSYFPSISEEQHSPDSFLDAYNTAISAVKRHLYRGSSYQYPHYVQGDILTGATRAFWMDSLSAYFPGLLTLSGDVEAGAEAHLLNAAVWNRFSGLPERWNIATGDAESGMAFWGGRPEFVESNYYLYRATGDPWYQHVGEMVLKDIKRRCWTECGWAGLLDVRTGELGDRMESFVLGETAKYLYLLYTPDHPLNHLDGPFVFSTEAHPLIIPDDGGANIKEAPNLQTRPDTAAGVESDLPLSTCPAPTPLPFGLSSIPSRSDYYHAASLVRLDYMASIAEIDSLHENLSDGLVTDENSDSPSNFTFFPWTLPPQLVPHNATCAPMSLRPTLDLSFPPLAGTLISAASMERVQDGILAKSLSGLRLGMIQDVPLGIEGSGETPHAYRIQVINNIPLGKDEKVYVPRRATALLNPTDPNFSQITDMEVLDLVIDLSTEWADPDVHPGINVVTRNLGKINKEFDLPNMVQTGLDQGSMKVAFSSLMNQVASLLRDESGIDEATPHDSVVRISIPAMTAAGTGAAPPPDVQDAAMRPLYASKVGRAQAVDPLSWSTIYVTDQLCDHRLPASVAKNNQVLVVKRGGCSFSQKIKNIPAFRPSPTSLQMVVVVSYTDDDQDSVLDDDIPQQPLSPHSFVPPDARQDEKTLVRPLLDEIQTVAGGVPRSNPISVVLVGGGDRTFAYFQNAIGIGVKRRYEIHSQGVPIINLFLA